MSSYDNSDLYPPYTPDIIMEVDNELNLLMAKSVHLHEIKKEGGTHADMIDFLKHSLKRQKEFALAVLNEYPYTTQEESATLINVAMTKLSEAGKFTVGKFLGMTRDNVIARYGKRGFDGIDFVGSDYETTERFLRNAMPASDYIQVKMDVLMPTYYLYCKFIIDNLEN